MASFHFMCLVFLIEHVLCVRAWGIKNMTLFLLARFGDRVRETFMHVNAVKQ